jgi:rhodanese-related sulfurtransferase
MPDLPLEIDVRSAKARCDACEDFLFLDCREPDEQQCVRIEGTMLLPMSQLVARLSELEPYRQQPIVVHCHHGGRSLRVARFLREQGFTNVQSMAGGIDQWSVEIDPSLPRYQ